MRKFIEGDMRKLSMLYKRAARYHFYHNNMRTSDYYHQWALNMAGRFPSANVTNCHKKQEPWESQLQNWRNEKEKNFTNETEQEAEQLFITWMIDPNKHQIAAVVANLINGFNLTKCIELGCHAGALISLIHVFLHRNEKERNQVRFVGIEPDPMPVEFGRKQLPNYPDDCQIEFHLGDHRKLAELSGKFDLLICSYTLCLNDEPVIREILNFASSNCRFLIFAEDLANMNEDKPVIRRHYIIHPYAKLLKEYGFMEIDRIFLENANEAANGILISENCN